MLPLASARADVFGQMSLVSVGSVGGGSQQQVEYAHDAAMSADGQWVAFDGAVGGVTGVWRRSLATGTIEQVAGGTAELPSISANGQVIAFTTNEGTSLAAETNDRPVVTPRQEAANVYVRNMGLGASEEGAFTVVSAPNGSSQPLSYQSPSTTRGSTAAGRSAISADGNEVAFVTTAVSDLADPGTPLEPTTPAYQVAVRYIASQETQLVSTDRVSGGPVSSTLAGTVIGAAYVGTGIPAFAAPPAYNEWATHAPAGASISADGSSVAWLATNVAAQAQMLPAEVPAPMYTEPLWKRIAPGSETPTERVTGGSDPTAPGCGEAALPPIGEQSPSDPCLGPFMVSSSGGLESSGIWPLGKGEAAGIGDYVPRLSADGYEVAFLSEARPKVAGADFGLSPEGQPADVYRADMHPGLSRDVATTTITELAGGQRISDMAVIDDLAISDDGEQIAFTTRRTQFPLGSPAFVSAPAPEPGLNELYEADLRDATLTRVTQGYEGGPSEQPHVRKPEEEDQYTGLKEAGAASPSFSADGALISFTSTASNLVFGDGDTPPSGPLDGSDAFLVQRLTPPTLSTSQTISSAPVTPTEPMWQIGVTARSLSDGRVLLYVAVPGAGSLRAGASSTLLLRPARGARRAARSHRSSRRRAARTSARLVSRAVARASHQVPGREGEIAILALALAKPYATLAGRRGGLAATVTVAFSAPSHATLRKTIEVAFARKAHVSRARRARSHRGRGR
jgi:Tol biopolymer transport system component